MTARSLAHLHGLPWVEVSVMVKLSFVAIEPIRCSATLDNQALTTNLSGTIARK
jgi:hypothetical protein